MPQKENPVALAGADRAGIRYAEQQSFTRESLKKQAQQRLRRQRLAERVHRLGARVVFELLDEIARHHDLGDDVDDRLARFAALDPAMLRAVGGARFAPVPLRAVGGGR
jgi:hypothetical protein